MLTEEIVRAWCRRTRASRYFRNDFPLSRWGEGRDDFMGNAEQIKYGVESSANLKTRRKPMESWRVGWVSDARRVINYLFSHKT